MIAESGIKKVISKPEERLIKGILVITLICLVPSIMMAIIVIMILYPHVKNLISSKISIIEIKPQHFLWLALL
jgi:hypothetical protein